MRAVVIRQGHLVVEDRGDPRPGDTELLLAVRAAGVNAADLMQQRGAYPAPPGSPHDIPGLELAGEVVAVGRQVTRYRVGDRVMGVVGGGGQATMAVLDESHALAVPGGLSWEEAGAFPEAFATAFDALFTQAGLGPGDRLLVTGAAGGVGTAAVQLASAAGATVVASVRRPEARPAVAALGAAEVVACEAAAEHGPYDVVLELVGAPSLAEALPALATGARVVVIGVSAGDRLDLRLLSLMAKRARIGGSTLRYRDRIEKAAVTAGLAARVLPLVRRGVLGVPLAATHPMAEVQAAYAAFASGGKVGKIVLLP